MHALSGKHSVNMENMELSSSFFGETEKQKMFDLQVPEFTGATKYDNAGRTH